MRITHVTLGTRSLDEAALFYESVLGLVVDRRPEAVIVHAGTTTVEFLERNEPGVHHLAFTIPSDQFDEAKSWLTAKTSLLVREGADEFEGPGLWNSRSVYFDGPDESILELIARRDLENPSGRAYDSTGILNVSEVGMAADDVPALVEMLRARASVPAYGEPGPTFAPVGDIEGLLIVVSPDRTWFPTGDRGAADRGITVRAMGGVAGDYAVGSQGLLIIEG
ncbi:MAG: hypothetical protein JWP75_2386 [Frondihabitans sp.]|nr:hypothetical protein [Frondihabitans sp.]